jgi:hypothetical protein
LLISKISANNVLAPVRWVGKRLAGGAAAHLAKQRSAGGPLLE